MPIIRLLAVILIAAAGQLAAQPAPEPGRNPAPAAPQAKPAQPTQTPGPAAPAQAATPAKPAAPAQAAPPAKPASPGAAQTSAKPAARKKGDKAPYQGPTEADIRVAYTERIDTINAGTTQYLDPAAAAKLRIKLVKVDIVECNAAEERQDLYICSVLVEAGVGDAAPEFKRIEIAMIKDKDAWRAQ